MATINQITSTFTAACPYPAPSMDTANIQGALNVAISDLCSAVATLENILDGVRGPACRQISEELPESPSMENSSHKLVRQAGEINSLLSDLRARLGV